MRTFVLCTFAMCVTLMGLTTFTNAETKFSSPLSDEEFVTMATNGGNYEIALGKIAKDRSSRDDVKKIADRMIGDHVRMNKELEGIAKKAKIAVPTTQFDKQQKQFDEISKLKGTDFDQAYAKQLVKDHQADMSIFERAMKHTKNADLKSFCEKAIPTLKEHLEMAKKLEK